MNVDAGALGSATLSPLEVWAGAESFLSQPLPLEPPLDFEVEVTPPLDPRGRPWSLIVRQASRHRAGYEEPAAFSGAAQPEGLVHLSKKAPGTYWIEVSDSAGNAMFSDRSVHLSSAGERIAIDLDLVKVTGTVRFGDEPVQGLVWFGGGSGSVRVEMLTDESGQFEGTLPKAGKWRVDVRGQSPRLRTTVGVDVRPKGAKAVVNIALPGTYIFGRVVDSNGNPARKAEVTAGTALGTLLLEVHDDGEFDAHAVPAGKMLLLAAAPSAAGRELSDEIEVEATEDVPLGPVVLTLRSNRSVRGRVLSTRGPVAAASVRLVGFQPPSAEVSTARTGLDGTFQLNLPRATHVVHGFVSPPGGVLKVFEAPLTEQEELTIVVAGEGGGLQIRIDPATLERELLVFWYENIPIPLGALAQWALGNGGRFHAGDRVLMIPALTPGTYTVCSAPPAVMDLDAWRKTGKCASGYVGIGSVLDLSLVD